MKSPIRFLATLIAATLLAGALAGCQRVLPVRTLPSWVRSLYIPMVANHTREPGLEEVATRLLQEEFLADGRLQIRRKSQADLQLAANIVQFWTTIDGDDRDHVADRETINMIVELKLLDPHEDPYDPKEIVADLGFVHIFLPYSADPRSVTYEVEPDRNHRALELMARSAVAQTITGFPTAIPTGQGAEFAPPPGDAQTYAGFRGTQVGSHSGYKR